MGPKPPKTLFETKSFFVFLAGQIVLCRIVSASEMGSRLGVKGEKGVQRPVVRTIEDLLSSKRLGDFVHSGWSTTRNEAGVIGVWAHGSRRYVVSTICHDKIPRN